MRYMICLTYVCMFLCLLYCVPKYSLYKPVLTIPKACLRVRVWGLDFGLGSRIKVRVSGFVGVVRDWVMQSAYDMLLYIVHLYKYTDVCVIV